MARRANMAGLAALAVVVSLFSVGVAAPATAGGASAGPVVVTTYGVLRGVRRGDVDAFLGVPFAAPPLGERRWRAPAPPAAWTGLREASTFGLACVQPGPTPFPPWTVEFVPIPPVSEDCLYLNVWRPVAHGNALPVLVWAHGGSFLVGAGSETSINGAALAARGAVVVTINYRRGGFGFFAHPQLIGQDGEGPAIDFGLQDQIAALRWVRDNIARFGGDPAKVTFAGQSAGANSVNDLMMSPLARGLFTRAIAQSGSGMGATDEALSPAQAVAQWRALAEAAGATDLATLKTLPTERVEAAFEKLEPRPDIMPTVDGRVLAADPEGAPRAPVWEAPLLTGYTADEGTFRDLRKGPVTPASFETMVRAKYGAMAPRFLALYPHSDAASALVATRQIARDRTMAGLIFWSEARARVGRAPIFLYLFDHVYPGPEADFYRSFHTSDTPYVFGNLDAPGRTFSADDRRIARQMQDAWLAFMRTGAAPWKPFQPGHPVVMGLGDRQGARPAVSTPERLAAFRRYVAEGGKLSFW